MSWIAELWGWWVGLDEMAGMRSLKGTLYFWTLYFVCAFWPPRKPTDDSIDEDD